MKSILNYYCIIILNIKKNRNIKNQQHNRDKNYFELIFIHQHSIIK